MNARYASVLVAGVAVLAACESPTSSQHALEAQFAAGGRVLASTSGGGKAQLPAGFSLLKFAFTANAHVNGSGSGQFRQFYENVSGTVDFHGEVTCVTFDVENRRAWVGGVITQNKSTHPGVQGEIHQPGRDVWFRVVDNGQGAAAAADRTTVFGFEGGGGIVTSEEYCALQLWTPDDANTWAAVSGNIQVRP